LDLVSWLQLPLSPASLHIAVVPYVNLSQASDTFQFGPSLRHFIVCRCSGASPVQINELTSAVALDGLLDAGDKVKPSLEFEQEIDASIRTYLLSTLLFQACQINELLQGTLQDEAPEGCPWVKPHTHLRRAVGYRWIAVFVSQRAS
jgi:hypothetical protein